MRTISRAQAEREADGRVRPQEGDCLCYRERKAYYKVPATGGKRLFGNADGFFYTREVVERKVLVADELFLAKKRRAGIDGCWCFLLFLLCFFPVFRIRISFMQSGFGIPKMSIRIRIHGDKH